MKHQTPLLPKFKKLKRRLGLTRDRDVIGLLESLWLMTQRAAPRGDIGAKFDNEEISIELEWEGNPDELVAALVDTKWLDACQVNRLVVHDWGQHAPRYVHGVAAKQGGFTTAVAVVPDYSPPLQSATTVGDYSQGQPILTSPILTKPDLLEEECTATESPSPAPAPTPDPRSPIFPCAGLPHGQTWQASVEQFSEWQGAFPDLDVEAAMRRMLVWIKAKSRRKKTARGMPAFVVSWLSGDQDNPRSRAGPQSSAPVTFERQKLENTKLAIMEFMDEGSGQGEVCGGNGGDVLGFLGRADEGTAGRVLDGAFRPAD